MKNLFLIFLCTLGINVNVFSQQKSIKDYYELWLEKTFEGEKAIFKPDNNQCDVINSYCSFSKFGASQMYGSMALWRSAKNQDIIGVFTYSCQMGTCEGMTEMVKFYDAKMNDITDKVFSKSVLEKDFKSKLDNIQARGANGDETFFCEIPKKGTTIKFMIKLGGEFMSKEWSMPIAELKYIKKTGKFIYTKQ